MKLFIKENGKWESEGINIIDLKSVRDKEFESVDMVAFIQRTEEECKVISKLESQRYYEFQSVKIVSDSGQLVHEFPTREYAVTVDYGPFFRTSESGENEKINVYAVTFHKLEAKTYVIEASYEDKVIIRQNFWLPEEKLIDKVDIEDNYHLLTEHIKAFYNNISKDGKIPTGSVKFRCLFVKDSKEELIYFLGSSAMFEIPITDIVCEKTSDEQVNGRIMSMLSELSDYILSDTRKIRIDVIYDDPEQTKTFNIRAYSFKKVSEVVNNSNYGRELRDYVDIVLEDGYEEVSDEIVEAINHPGSGKILFSSTGHGFSFILDKDKYKAELYEDKYAGKLLSNGSFILSIFRI